MPYDLIWQGGFDDGLHHTAGAWADHIYWGSGSARSTASSKTGPASMKIVNTNYSFRIKFDASYSDVVVGHALYMDTHPTNSSAWNILLWDWRDSVGNRMGGLQTQWEDTYIYYGAGQNSDIGSDHYFDSLRNKWTYIEHYFSPRLGTWQIRRDEQHVWTFNYQFNSYGTDCYYLYMGADCPTMYIDDVYVLGANGEAPPFWGETQVYDLAPTGNGQYSEWYGDDGDQVDNYLRADQDTPDMNTEHVFTPYANKRDTYAFEDIPALGLGEQVRGVQYDLWGQYTGGPDKTANTRALVYNASASPTLTNSPDEYTYNDNIDVGGHPMLVNPATGLGWTEDEVNNSEFGHEYMGENP